MMRARELTLTQAQYRVIDDVLYHIEPARTLQIVLPTVDRQVVFDEVHSGILGAYLRTWTVEQTLLMATNAC